MVSGLDLVNIASYNNFLGVGVWTKNFAFFLGVNHVDLKRIPVYMAGNPAGTSVRNMLHFAQGMYAVDFYNKVTTRFCDLS